MPRSGAGTITPSRTGSSTSVAVLLSSAGCCRRDATDLRGIDVARRTERKIGRPERFQVADRRFGPVGVTHASAGSAIFSVGIDDLTCDDGGRDRYRPKIVEENDVGDLAGTDTAIVVVDAKTLRHIHGGELKGLDRIEACFDQDAQAMIQVAFVKKIVGMDVVRAQLKQPGVQSRLGNPPGQFRHVGSLKPSGRAQRQNRSHPDPGVFHDFVDRACNVRVFGPGSDERR